MPHSLIHLIKPVYVLRAEFKRAVTLHLVTAFFLFGKDGQAVRCYPESCHPAFIWFSVLAKPYHPDRIIILITSLWQRINILQPVLLATLLGMCAFVGIIIWGFGQMDKDTMNTVTTLASNMILLGIILCFILAGFWKKVNVYDAFIEGAKEGFTTAVKIIPYLVAILVGIGVFRASGAMDMVIQGISWSVEQCGLNADFVGALPTAIMKPLSGSGARGMMLEAMKNYGPDSFVGRLSCIFQGSTDTTFYILAVYFGSVSIRNTRHAVACGLLADLAGVIAAIAIAYLFFG